MYVVILLSSAVNVCMLMLVRQVRQRQRQTGVLECYVGVGGRRGGKREQGEWEGGDDCGRIEQAGSEEKGG